MRSVDEAVGFVIQDINRTEAMRPGWHRNFQPGERVIRGQIRGVARHAGVPALDVTAEHVARVSAAYMALGRPTIHRAVEPARPAGR